MRWMMVVVFLLAPAIARADQFIYNELPAAVKGMQKLQAAKEITHFCAPCLNERPRVEKVSDVGIELVWRDRATSSPFSDGKQQFWKVFVNDDAIDMAYVYVRENGQWRNLAELIGLKPTDVPSKINP